MQKRFWECVCQRVFVCCKPYGCSF